MSKYIHALVDISVENMIVNVYGTVK